MTNNTSQIFVDPRSGLSISPAPGNPGHHYVALAPHYVGRLSFQDGPVPTSGVNGFSNESVIAVLINRISILNSLFPCTENVQALAHLQSALDVLNLRTKKRVERGVEGKEVL